MSPTLIAILVFVATVVLVVAAGLVIRDLRAMPVAPSSDRPAPLQRLASPPPDDAVRGPVAAFDQWFVRLLHEAAWQWNPTSTVLLLILIGIVCGAAMYVVDERMGPAAIVGAVAAVVPLVYLMIRRSRRLSQLQEQLPAALESLSRSLRAGQTLEQGIMLLGQHSPDPLAREFRWCSQQMQMGLPLQAVMRSLTGRLPLYDARIFATTLIVHRQSGGNVVTVLERLAQVIRERLNFRRQLRATTAAGRMSAGLVAIVAPSVFTYFFFFQPDYINKMLQSPLGQSLLMVAVVLEIVGLIWTARLVRPVY
jgi:tight adherence protein B